MLTTGCMCLCWALTQFNGYICVNDGVFVPPSDNMPLCVSFYDTGGLKHVPLHEAQEGPNAEDSTPRDAKESLPS
ncbi:hypothetical protein Taro_013252, partial [Colocasia esculenta]|nr:hypothetical protein [Colocasia esculenta]